VIGPREELIEAAIGMAVEDTGDDVGETTVRFEADQLAGLDERGDHRPMLGAAVRTGKQSVLAGQCQRTDGSFDDVAIDLNTIVVEKQAQPVPA
jgi:hypothetical protein